MELLKKWAWLALGIFLAHVVFYVAAALTVSGVLKGKLAPVGLVVSLAALIGILLCGRASKKNTCLMGFAIAAYMPGIRGLLWGAALTLDVLRRDGLPGLSLTAMINLPANTSLMLIMIIIAFVVTASGLLCARVTRGRPLKIGA